MHDDPRDGEPVRRRAFEGIFGGDPRRFFIDSIVIGSLVDSLLERVFKIT